MKNLQYHLNDNNSWISTETLIALCHKADIWNRRLNFLFVLSQWWWFVTVWMRSKTNFIHLSSTFNCSAAIILQPVAALINFNFCYSAGCLQQTTYICPIIWTQIKVPMKSKSIYKCLYHICLAWHLTYMPVSASTTTKKVTLLVFFVL